MGKNGESQMKILNYCFRAKLARYLTEWHGRAACECCWPIRNGEERPRRISTWVKDPGVDREFDPALDFHR